MKGEIHLVQNDMSIIRHVAHYESDGWSPHGRSFMVTNDMISQPTKGVQYTVETDYGALQNDQLAVQSIRLKINNFGESQNEEEPSSVFFHLTFDDFLPNQQIVQEGQRDYYDNVSEFLPHFRL